MPESIEVEIRRAAEAIAGAEGMIIGAGAGMGVDSGLPDFRGRDGFWNAYPAYRRLGLDFVGLANPRWFRDDPRMAWGFYGHRLNLYRRTVPHPGFRILLAWAGRMPMGAFVYTSNVDGQFHRAGFDPDRISEIHGAIDRLQCTSRCGVGLFPAGPDEVAIDAETLRAEGLLPQCPGCGSLARPNILMFGDWDWDASVAREQSARQIDWLRRLRGPRLVAVECGAGTAIPSVRLACEDLCPRLGGPLIRINPRESAVPSGQIGIPLGALEGLKEIQRLLEAASAS